MTEKFGTPTESFGDDNLLQDVLLTTVFNLWPLVYQTFLNSVAGLLKFVGYRKESLDN